jgi:4-amino-4-deoxy-L-arabinose transferase-like glycosyltransferase
MIERTVSADAPTTWWSRRSFRTQLLLIVGLGFVIRFLYLMFVTRDDRLWGDAYAYYWSGRLLAEGHGFIQPLPWVANHVRIESPDRPPGYFLFLGFWSLIGIKSWLAQRFFSIFLGLGSIYVAGLIGKEVAGRRVGLVAAFIAAVYPYFWIHDGMGMSETMTILTVSICLLLAYRYWREPSWQRAVWLGVSGGIGALTHPDTALTVALFGIAVVLLAKGQPWRRRAIDFTLVGATALLVLSPWVIRNMVVFDEPVYLSTGLDVTLAVTNCDETYHGEYRAFWYMECATRHTPPKGDLSVQAVYWRHLALDYVKDHKSEVPGIVAARVGRMWGLYRPFQQVRLNILEGHRTWISWTGLGFFYVLTPSAIAGLVLLRRRRIPIIPFLAPVFTVTFSAIITFGNTRYRAAAEITLAVCAAVAFVALWERWRPPVEPDEAPAPPPEEDRALVDAGV